MKRGTLNFLGRKNQSLFDTNTKMKDMDNVELVLGSSAIPESGTASVRARPTVKHHIPSPDSFQGYAVPTPKVPVLPVLPSFNGLNTNGSASGDRMSNGSAISAPDLAEGEIFVPPPPSMAPPPPPPNFIPPPPDFMGDLNDIANLQPPSIPAPKLPPLPPEDLTLLKPPPMAPPKPPSSSSSSCISTSSSPVSSPPEPQIPNRPRFSPPQAPNEKQKTLKTPPPKPTRLSSMSSFDSLIPPNSPVPQTPTVSSFNPQNAAKLYNVPETSILSGNMDNEARPKQLLLLEDSGSVYSAPVLTQTDGKAPPVVPQSKPVRRNISEQLQEPKESSAQPPLLNREARTGTVSAPQDVNKLLQEILLEKENSAQMNSNADQSALEGSPSESCRFSPLLDRKLRTLKSSESSGVRDGATASPLALLMAAKERDKHRSLSRESSAKYSETSSSSIHQSNSNPNSFVVTPRSGSSTLLTTQNILQQQSPTTASPVEHRETSQSPGHIRMPALVRDGLPSTRLSTDASKAAVQRQEVKSWPAQGQADREEPSMPLLPPPPEFDDFDEMMLSPPSIRPPDPPKKKAPSPTVSPTAQLSSPLPKPKPPTPPKLPPPVVDAKPKLVIQTKPKPAQPPASLSPGQSTLLGILQKKMLEMDHKMSPVKDSDPASDDWGSPLSDEEANVPVVRKVTAPQNNIYAVVNKKPSLDMSELENKVARKYQEASPVKAPTSNGPQSKHQYGMTFTVRPGAKQPITLVSKGDSS